ncbi:hypothetical protein A1O3_03555 [Capronia epimyces CBS 606.96]|uniref:Zn(2)-C6 fungal-type domain-containing protein n=1 Tax=Capronia epimyces CBS 606.96 TaxID=1182542 RepID=W9Y1B4_9EURO|nr:uncharacterized protein A1O3_03555 [Capronia epimyces CBS 606.96]EXJ86602.1 hypothetical protein A1O3_03555 [Capronia epimyces CBS 606.96]
MSYAETATAFYNSYGPYPIASIFAAADWAPNLAESEVPTYSAAFDADLLVKRHAACDECRKRKLKCSGAPSGCERCLKQHLICHYSAQKQMGRPRKKQKVDHTSELTDTTVSAQSTECGSQDDLQSTPLPTRSLSRPPGEPAQPVDPVLPVSAIERTQFENVCNGPISQAIKRSNMYRARAQNAPFSQSLQDGGSGNGSAARELNNTSPYNGPRTPLGDTDSLGTAATNASYPTDFSQWPDFSDMTMLPMIVQDSHAKEKIPPSSSTNFPFSPVDGTEPPYPANGFGLDANPSSLTQLPTIPDCPCLPNLYLTLSTLSTLTAFPVSSETIHTLLGAQRTGRGVIYCDICPQKFQSGSQNVMMSSMLVTILADQWQRVKNATATELRNGFVTDAGAKETSGSYTPSRLDPDAGADADADVFLAPHTNPNTKSMSAIEDLQWRLFGFNLVRAYVFGDAPVPTPPGSSSQAKSMPSGVPYTLCDLCSALERRQKQRHGMEPVSGEFPPSMTEDLTRGHTAGMVLEDSVRCAQDTADGHLCLKMVDHARLLINNLEDDPPQVEM